MAEKSGGIDFVAGFVVGALVGTAVALLMAPQSGEDTRSLIRDKGLEIQERSVEMSAEARRRAADIQAQAKERAVDLQVKVKQAVEEGKSIATEQKEEMLTGLGDDIVVDEVVVEETVEL
jgi:gas vesicle protein